MGRGWSKKRPEFKGMLADEKMGRFETIICWKSNQLNRGLYSAASLTDVDDVYRINIAAAMEAIEMRPSA